MFIFSDTIHSYKPENVTNFAWRIGDFDIVSDIRMKIKENKEDKHLDLARELKKAMKHEGEWWL